MFSKDLFSIEFHFGNANLHKFSKKKNPKRNKQTNKQKKNLTDIDLCLGHDA